MKRTLFIAIMLLLYVAANAQDKPAVKDPVGKWKFEAPYAPEGYTNGTIEVKKVEDKLAGTLSFEGNEYKMPLEKVKLENDTLSCSIFIDSEDIQIVLKFEEADKLAGKAVSSGGEIPLTCVRVKENEK